MLINGMTVAMTLVVAVALLRTINTCCRLRALEREMQELRGSYGRALTEIDLLQQTVMYFHARDQVNSLSPDECLRDQVHYERFFTAGDGEEVLYTPSVMMKTSRTHALRLLHYLKMHHPESKVSELVKRAMSFQYQ